MREHGPQRGRGHDISSRSVTCSSVDAERPSKVRGRRASDGRTEQAQPLRTSVGGRETVLTKWSASCTRSSTRAQRRLQAHAKQGQHGLRGGGGGVLGTSWAESGPNDDPSNSWKFERVSARWSKPWCRSHVPTMRGPIVWASGAEVTRSGLLGRANARARFSPGPARRAPSSHVAQRPRAPFCARCAMRAARRASCAHVEEITYRRSLPAPNGSVPLPGAAAPPLFVLWPLRPLAARRLDV